jgi:hypothetical protein
MTSSYGRTMLANEKKARESTPNEKKPNDASKEPEGLTSPLI